MSAQQSTQAPPLRRVRHEVRDGLAVAAFSLAASTALVLLLALVAGLAG